MTIDTIQELLISLGTFIGIVTSLIIGISTFVKAKSEAQANLLKTQSELSIESIAMSQKMNQIASDLIDDLRKELELKLKDLEVKTSENAQLRAQVMILTNKNDKLIDYSKRVITAIQKSIESRTTAITQEGNLCAACTESDKYLLESLNELIKMLS